MSSKRKQHLTRSVLRGLAMATLLSGSLVSTSYAASTDDTQTTTNTHRAEVQQQIKDTPADQTLNVTNLQAQDIATLDSTGENGKQVVNVGENGILLARAEGDQTTSNLKDVVTNANGQVFVYHGTPEDMEAAVKNHGVVAASPSLLDSTGTTDLSNTNLVLNGDSSMTIVNGTVVEKAENILADLDKNQQTEQDSWLYPSSTNARLYVGIENDVQHPAAKLKLTGDSYDDQASQSVFYSPSNKLIQVNPTGTLEANSSLVFYQGLSDDEDMGPGMNRHPGGINGHLDFKNGSTIQLDDPLYNDEYLENANHGWMNGKAKFAPMNPAVSKDTMITVGGKVDGAGNLTPADADQMTQNLNFRDLEGMNDGAFRMLRVVNDGTANIHLQNGDVYRSGIYDNDHKAVLQAGRMGYSNTGNNEGASTGTLNLQFDNPDGAVANLTNVELKPRVYAKTDKDGNKAEYRSSINIVNGTVETMLDRLQDGGDLNVGADAPNAQKATLRLMDKSGENFNWERSRPNITIHSSGTLEGQSGVIFKQGLDKVGVSVEPDPAIDYEGKIYIIKVPASNYADPATFKNGSSIVLDDSFYNDEYLENAKHYLANANNRYGFGWVQDADGNDTTTPVSVNLAMNPNAINVSHTVDGGTETLNFNALEGMNGGNLRIVRAINGGTANINLKNGDSFRGGRDDEISGALIQAGRANFTGDITGGSQGTVNLQFANPENATANLKNVGLTPKTYPTLNANVDAKTATSNDVTYHDSVINLVNGTVQSEFDNISPLASSTTIDSKGNVVSTFNYVDKDGNPVERYTDTDKDGNSVVRFHKSSNQLYGYGYVEVNPDEVSLSSITGQTAGVLNVQKAATVDFSGFDVYRPNRMPNPDGSTTIDYRPKGVKVEGVIKANSFQLFDKGVGGLGTNADPGMKPEEIKDRLGFFDFQDGSTLLLNDPFVQDAEGNHTASDAYLAAVKNALGANVNVKWANANAKAPAVTDYTSAMGSQSVGALNLGTNPMDNSQNLTAQMLGANGNADGILTATISNSTFTLGTPNDNVELFTDSANGWLPNSNARLDVQNNTTLTLNTGDANKSNHFTGTIALADTQDAAEGQTQQQNTLNFNGGKVLVDTVTAGNHAQVNVNQGAQAQISNLTLNAGSQLNVAGGTYDGSLFAGQSASIQAGSDSAINITNGGTVRNVSIQSNSTDSNAPAPRINIGNDQGAGHLELDGGSLTNAQVFLDPVWGNGTQGTYEGASTLTNPNGSVDYALTVGQNSIASIGTNASTNAEQAFHSVAAEFGQNNRTAVLYVDSPITVNGNGGIRVDGSLTNASSTRAEQNAVNFAAGSALLVNGNGNFNGNAVINGSGTTTLTVDPNSKVYFTGKIDGTVGSQHGFQLASNVNSDANANNWYTHPDREHGIVAPWNFEVADNGQGSVTLTRRNWSALNGAMQNIVNGVWDSMPASANGASLNPATEALFGANGSMQGWRSPEEAAALTNMYSMPAETTGATYLATQATHSLTDTAQNRYSLLGEDMETDDAGIWLKYGHSNFNVEGLEMSNLDGNFDGNYNTISLGFDFARNENFAQGIALGYAKGSSSGRFGESNDFHVGGLSYYGAVHHGRSNTLFDLGYYKAKSDVDGVIDANPDTDLLSLGVKNEYRFDAGEHASYVPYIGLRWTRVNTDSYTGSYGGNAVFSYNPSTENLFTLPLGVSYLKETQAKDWNYKFKIDLGYVAALGGRSADMNVTALGGSNASGTASYDIADQSTWLAGLGFNASNSKMHWGLGYQYHHSSDSHGHNITANIGWSF